MTLLQVASKLQEVNKVLAAYSSSKTLDFEQGYILAKFYADFKDTNSIIDAAESMLNNSPVQLIKDAQRLLEVTSAFRSIYTDNEEFFTAYNPKPCCEEYLALFEEKYNSANEVAVKLWKQYSELNIRLDYLDEREDDYRELEAECEARKAKYDEAKNANDTAFQVFDTERKRVITLYNFEMFYLDVLVTRLQRIAESIVSDIENLKSEGGIC